MEILLLEDHPIFRLGVRQLILQHWPAAHCTEAGTLREALAAVRTQDLDLAIVDLNLPDADGIEAVTQLRRAAPALRILVLSFNAEAAYARRVLALGAVAYLAKDRAGEELLQAIERVRAGGRYITASLAERLADLATGTLDRPPHEELSAQEYRVLVHLAAGRRITDVAALMHLSPKTVTTYRARVLEKLGAASNADLTRYCLAQGLADGPDVAHGPEV